METLKERTSWAHSGKLHEEWKDFNKKSIETIMEDYEMPVVVKEVERSTSKGDALIRCRICGHIKDKEYFVFDNVIATACKGCLMGIEDNSVHLADAPIISAVRLMEEEPEALAMIIKHYRPKFEKIYKEEVANAA